MQFSDSNIHIHTHGLHRSSCFSKVLPFAFRVYEIHFKRSIKQASMQKRSCFINLKHISGAAGYRASPHHWCQSFYAKSTWRWQFWIIFPHLCLISPIICSGMDMQNMQLGSAAKSSQKARPTTQPCWPSAGSSRLTARSRRVTVCEHVKKKMLRRGCLGDTVFWNQRKKVEVNMLMYEDKNTALSRNMLLARQTNKRPKQPYAYRKQISILRHYWVMKI